MIYYYIKAFHIISIIAWMVGLLYLPRIYVYHSEVLNDTISYDIFLIMERRLIKIIMFPSMILSVVFGLILLYENHYLLNEHYFQLKLVFLLFLFAFHGYLIKQYKNFLLRNSRKTANFFRKINEIPTILMIFIIILVVVKPKLL